MLVKATNKYKELNLKDNELGRIPEAGEQWEITEERYKVLTQTNKYNAVFVEKVEKVKEVETTTKKVKAGTVVKKTKTTKKGTKKK